MYAWIFRVSWNPPDNPNKIPPTLVQSIKVRAPDAERATDACQARIDCMDTVPEGLEPTIELEDRYVDLRREG